MDFYLVALFCIAITLHNMEEALWLPKWSQQASKFHKPVTPSEFHFAVFVITMLAYLSAFYFYFMPASELAKWFFIGFIGSMIVNAIFPHLIATILLKRYAPGLLTGLFLNIPINSFIIVQMLQNNYITWTELILSTIAVGSLLLALIPLLFKAGERTASSREQ
ncbi:HXXEE domain-containing protein [Ureibacillus thermophilus]|uniref:HXXEE domain-containing protein n=1 Tax=Ureibacillus thermophilus TaxID=367743 RepID=A0A4P6URI2_9BACL|nr:HXXEE domain-containing protein [Ureibacillus thermophilus]QBK24508.1 HXXEE domain-containing protein [Ureibacillus thermophilus]